MPCVLSAFDSPQSLHGPDIEITQARDLDVERLSVRRFDCSIAITRDCFESGSIGLFLGSRTDCCDDFEANTGVAEAADDFFADFDIGILGSADDGLRAVTTEAPFWPQGRRGRISERRFGAPGIVDSTAPTAAKC